MARVLVAFGTSEGHTRKICERVSAWIRELGDQPVLLDCSDPFRDISLSEFDWAVLAGSLHQAKHQSCLTEFARDHREELNGMPTAFLSVSLSAVGKDEKHMADCQKCIDGFEADTGLKPFRSMPVAGALLYTKYDFLTKQFMRMICMKEGGDTDTSKDYEYTDWQALQGFIEGFLREARAPAKIVAGA